MDIRLDNLYRLGKKDIPEARLLLSKAFRDDPLWMKVFENELRFEERFATFFETPLRFCLTYGAVYATSSRLEGIISFLPDQYADMTIWRIIRSGALGSALRMGMQVAKRMQPMAKQLGADRHKVMNGKSYLYLFALGVAPEFQKQGFGGKLLVSLIDACTSNGYSLYLETATEGNVQMYEKYGLSQVKKIIVEGIGVPMWEMVRNPA